MSSTKTAPEAVSLPDAGLQPVRVHANLSAAQLRKLMCDNAARLYNI